MRTRLLNMTRSNLRFNVWRSFVTMATNLPSCFSIQFLEQLLKFLVNFTLLKYVKSQRNYGFLITKELMFGFSTLDLKDHFSASLKNTSGYCFIRWLLILRCFLEMWLIAWSSGRIAPSCPMDSAAKQNWKRMFNKIVSNSRKTS